AWMLRGRLLLRGLAAGRSAAVALRHRGARLEHRPPEIAEIELALAVGDQHPMRTEEVDAQEHLRSSLDRPGNTAAGLSVGRILEHAAEEHRGIANRLVADRETGNRTDPDID